jgi:hypothetical protein
MWTLRSATLFGRFPSIRSSNTEALVQGGKQHQLLCPPAIDVPALGCRDRSPHSPLAASRLALKFEKGWHAITEADIQVERRQEVDSLCLGGGPCRGTPYSLWWRRCRR